MNTLFTTANSPIFVTTVPLEILREIPSVLWRILRTMAIGVPVDESIIIDFQVSYEECED